jgi:hypothetical protein
MTAAAQGSTTPQLAVMATKPERLPFMHMLRLKEGSPVLRSSMYRLVKRAVIPPAAPDRAVLTAA